MQHEGLFTKAHVGTKLLAEEYHDTVAKALNFICDETLSEDVSLTPHTHTHTPPPPSPTILRTVCL